MQAHIELLEAQLAEARERELWFRRQLEDAQRLLPAPTPNPQPAPRRPWILLVLLLAALALAGWWWRAVIVAALAA
jgi:ferric-dicitrate binding protein FerR (iron transport regulator)